MEEQTLTIPTYDDIINNGKWYFLQQIEKQEIIDEKTGEKTVNFIENPKTGGEFVVYDKEKDISEDDKLGTLYLHQGKLYIVNKKTQKVTSLPTNTFEDLDELKNKYSIYYVDKEKPSEPQPVSIEDENDIQTNEGIVLSFNKKKLFSGDTLYLNTIYNGKFNQNNGFTGYVNSFHNNGNISYCSNLKNNNLDGYCIAHRNDGTILFSGVFKNSCFDGKDNKEYNPLTIQYGKFKNSCLYSGSVYLREDLTGKTVEELNAEQINPDKKIYTLERDKENPDIRTITYYGRAIGLEEDIELQMTINENNIVTSLNIFKNEEQLKDEKEIENITNKIKKNSIVFQ